MPVALVTGSSRGIGRAIARRYASDGYDVAVNYRASEDAAVEVVRSIESVTEQDAVAIQADVSVPSEAERLVNRTRTDLGGLDHVVNNAGIEVSEHCVALSREEFDRLMDVNLNSAFTVTKAALPSLKQSSDTPGPSIVNVASRVAYTGAAAGSGYVSSKAGLVGLTKSHAREFGPEIRVNAIAPGKIDTEMNADHSDEERRRNNRTIPLDRYGAPEEVADAAAYLRDASYVTGETAHVNGGETMV